MKSFLMKIENKLFKKKYYSTYEDALGVCPNKGYDDEDLARVIYLKTKQYKEDLAAGCSVSGNITEAINLMANVIRDIRPHIRVLDFGGACGATYFTINKLLGQNYKLDWGVIETQMMCKYGRSLENGELKFFSDIQEAKENMPEIDFINVSGSLQYVDRPYRLLDNILNNNSKFILFSRMCFNSADQDIITVQKNMLNWHGEGRLPSEIKNKELSFPFTVIRKSEFDCMVQKNYEYVRISTDNSGLIPINDEQIFGLSLLCRHKTEQRRV